MSNRSFIILVVLGWIISLVADTWWLWLPAVVLEFFVDALHNTHGPVSRFVRKWNWRLGMRGEVIRITRRWGGLMAYPLLVYINFEGEADYVRLGHKAFAQHLADYGEERTDKVFSELKKEAEKEWTQKRQLQRKLARMNPARQKWYLEDRRNRMLLASVIAMGKAMDQELEEELQDLDDQIEQGRWINGEMALT